MLTCREATRLFSESQERPLTLREKTALRLHTAMCAGCRHCQRHMDTLRQAARGFAEGAGENENKENENEK
ncbi:MAG: zf-HC2 domain-containing protein [Gammaproteobacteria bacterium]|nr:zf-HC2 domain-containing protein [Gammaproteobacteria bacterium]